MEYKNKNKAGGHGSKNKHLLDICKKAALMMPKGRIDQFELFAASHTGSEIEVFNGKVDTLSSSDSAGLGVRVFKDKAMGYAYTAVLEDAVIEDTIEKSIANSSVSKRDQFNYLPEPGDFRFSLPEMGEGDLFDSRFMEYKISSKIGMALRLEELTRKMDPRIKGVRYSIYEDGISDTVILNSNGLCEGCISSVAVIYVSAISKDSKDTSTGDYFDYGRGPAGLDVETVASEAARRSVELLGGKKIKSQVLDIVLEPLIAAQLLGVLAPALCADAVIKGKSLFKDMQGQKVFPSFIDVFDHGTMPGGLYSRPFDGEGAYRGKTTVFGKGILKTFLHNTYTARRSGTSSTGNASRASYRSVPEVGPSNFYIGPGSDDMESIFKGIDKGFYVTDIIGLHSGTNPISGQMSVGARGRLIEKGSLSYPVREVTIATDILTFAASILKTGKDVKFMPGGGFFGSPALLVGGISVSGK